MAQAVTSSCSIDISEEIEQKYREILISNGITDEVAEVIENDAGVKGEQMASVTRCVTIKFENADQKDLNLFVKLLPVIPEHKVVVKELKAFEKEARFLTEYVTAAKEFCDSKGLTDFVNFYPKCYYGDDEMVVLENLVLDRGFTLLSKLEKQDLEAATLALKTLAKHHALSYAMIQEAGGATEFFSRFPNLDFDGRTKSTVMEMLQSCIETSMKANIGILEKFHVKGSTSAAVKLKSFNDQKPIQMILNVLEGGAEDEDLRVLAHGDYWNNNMMFLKDPESGKVQDVVAIDLQGTVYTVPALDLGYFMYTSVQIDVRQQHLQDLLKLYLETFIEVANNLGHSVDLTEEELSNQYLKNLDWGFWTGFAYTVGPGLSAFEGVDINSIDLSDWASIFDEQVQRWMSEHPDEGKVMAKELVKLVSEYEQLSLQLVL